MVSQEVAMIESPKLRPLRAFPAEYEGNQIVCIRDATGFVDQVLGIPLEVFYIFPYMDGTRTLRDLQAQFMQLTGKLVTTEILEQLVEDLDENLFLESERFEAYQSQVIEEFRSLPVRPASHAGLSYSDDPKALKEQLEGYFQTVRGRDNPLSVDGLKISGLIAPHIDIRAGGPCYASAYQCLADAKEKPKLVVILGTGHCGLPGLFAGTRKDFQTPHGLARTDTAFMDKLAERFGEDLFEDEYAHRSEHVIEFQLIFLQHVLGSDFQIAPILCSFDHHFLDAEDYSDEQECIQRFCDALRESLSEVSDACLVASVDFSHVGPSYGDEEGLDSIGVAALERKDRKVLDAIESGDLGAFVKIIEKNDNASRICGFPPIYVLMKTLAGFRARTLDYASTQIDNFGSTVTFASMLLSPDIG